jgi:hypothetical protein
MSLAPLRVAFIAWSRSGETSDFISKVLPIYPEFNMLVVRPGASWCKLVISGWKLFLQFIQRSLPALLTE